MTQRLLRRAPLHDAPPFHDAPLIGTAVLGAALYALAFVFPASLRAQAELSLTAAQREARAQAPEALALRARVEGADLIAADARRVLRDDPTLALRYQTDLDREGGKTLSAELAWTVDVRGSWGPRGDAAAAEREAAAHQAHDGFAALDEAVATAVAELALAQRQLARASRVASLHDVLAGAARRQLELGQGNQLDDDGAQLDRAVARAELARAESERERAATSLARLLGRRDATQLGVEDPEESAEQPAPQPALDHADHAPAVRAASASQRAAERELALQRRLVWPTPTFGFELAREEHAIPAGAFAGTTDASLSATWNEWQIGFTLQLPLGVFDRNQEQRAQAYARLLNARAEFERARADARTERLASTAELRAAVHAYRELEPTAAILERSYRLLEQAARAGALDSVSRALALQRLHDAGRRLDLAVRDLRVARARFARRSATTAR